MSHFQTHSLCTKLQKWMNLKSLPSVHTSNTHCSHLHTHSHNNSIIMSSPYKKTTFETLLRKYPKNQDELKCSRISFQNDIKENPKRTFESRMIKYDNIKSKIDTNLANLKQSKHQASVPQQNDENNNTQNIMPLNQQQQNEKINYQKPLIKKIKLNSEYFHKFQQQKSDYHSCVDVEDMIMRHNFRPSGYQEKIQNGKTLFRINVAKRINLLKKKQENYSEEIQGEGHKQQEPSMDHHNSENEQSEMHSPIIVQNPHVLSEYEIRGQSPEQPTRLLNFENTPKLLFKELGSKGFEVQLNNEGEQSQQENDIFTLDGYRILDDNNQIENYQPSHYEQHHMQNQQLHQIKLNPFQEIQQNHYEEEEESDLFQSEQPRQQQIGQTCQIAQQKLTLSESQVSLPQNVEIFPSNSVPLIDTITGQPYQSTQEKQNINQNIQANLQSEKPKPRQQKQRVRKNSKPKKETKILTRSKEDKLNLFNQLSMRLIRKKYGQELSHSELADRMLSEESRIELKAFIESESLQSHKTVFDFNELTQTQMRNTLIRYFASEQKGPNNQ